MFVWVLESDSGINSTIMTYIMAPAANASKNGNATVIIFVNNKVMSAPNNSKIADTTP